MYLQHWKLTHSPFAPRYAAKCFYASPTHDEALARLLFLVEDGRRVGLLLGAQGSGKSVTLEVLQRELHKTGATVALLSLLGLDEDEVLWQLAAACGLNPPMEASRGWLWRNLQDFLATERHQQRATALLFDDAHEASPEVLTLISRFLEWDQTPESRLTVVLSTTPDLAARLGQRVLQLAELRVSLERWGACDTADYVRAMLLAAKCETPAFSDDALQAVHRLADGNPRQVAQLANLALLAGAGGELAQVQADTVQGVFDELALGEVMVPR